MAQRKGYDKAMGARPMVRLMQENLKKSLANALLFGSLVDGGSVQIELDKESQTLKYHFISALKRKAEGAVH